jgi:hypothetical protein
MPRVLTACRATVPSRHQPEYLATLGRLAERMRARGESLWVFRSTEAPDTFLEFSESRSVEAHRSRRRPEPEDAALEQRLHAIADYAADAGPLWTEVPLEER